ncbi:hypothetical protein G7Z17_g3038 [Cylindrodendrum hubeiense]|uniref:Cytochrome P450 n=1 Tax=Cylindrodendrum hubeiense TaxID=595255 RepID=A0A9P5LJS0_9HYPO|nr:hypothetical protein G7Z17_g3038 [Cylindrodendrum hubeiense]
MILFTFGAIFIALFICIKPLAEYFWDARKLQRFPNQNCLSGITNFGYIIERCRGFRSRNLHEIHKVHPVVRVGPDTLSFSTPEAIRAIYGHSTKCVKGDMYSASAGPHASILDAVDKDEHAQKRRGLSHAFATRNIETWEFKVVDKVQRLVGQFDRICDEAAVSTNAVTATVDYSWWVNLFTIEAIVDIALSYRLGCIERGNDLVLALTPSGQKKAGQEFDDMVQYLARERIHRHHNGEELDDLVRHLLKDKDGNERNLTIGEVNAEVAVFLDAGSDTTAIALSHVMYYLLRTPSALARLQKEVTGAIGVDEMVPSYDRVKGLSYLRACLDESMRLSPPVSFGVHRKTTPEGASIDGNWIPGNTTIAVPAYSAHRNPIAFPEPEKYRPERWLESSGKDMQTSFIPFSTGARGCIGRNISYIEQSVLLATLVNRTIDFGSGEAQVHSAAG